MERRRERRTTWLPSVEEVFGAPERAALAALDATLQLAIRSLLAEHPGLDRRGHVHAVPGWEPYVPPQVPLVGRIVQAAGGLHRLIAQYRASLEPGPEAGADDERHDDVHDDSFPF
jgi:hypothetical protein